MKFEKLFDLFNPADQSEYIRDPKYNLFHASISRRYLLT